MVNLKGPLHSQSASGKLGKSLQFASGRGGPFAGKRRKPKQPRTTAQRATRIWMTWLTSQWKQLSDEQQSSWRSAPLTKDLSPYHSYVRFNTNRFKNLPGLQYLLQSFHTFPTKAYPPTETGDTATIADSVATGGQHQITHNFNVTWLGWNWAVAYFLRTAENLWPTYRTLVAIQNVEANGPYSITIANLPAGSVRLNYCLLNRTGNPKNWWNWFTATVTD